MTENEQDARYGLMEAKAQAKNAVKALAGTGAPGNAEMSALAVVDACDKALRELDLRIRAGEAVKG